MGTDAPKPSRIAIVLAFACIYVLWGSTYLAIRMAVETLPPFLMAGVRFLIAGSLLYGWGFKTGERRPTARHWRNAAIAGVPLFVVGNGGVTWAEQSVPSGLAALIVATLPAWLLLFDWMCGGRSGPGFVEIAGIGLGLSGVAVLLAPTGGDDVSLAGIGALILSALAWAGGSLFLRHADLPSSPVRSAGMQMLAGSVAMLAIGFVTGEASRLNLSAISFNSIIAFVYLVAVAIVAVPSYTWLITVSSPALVGTYAFVNPVVAVFLGWAAGESLGGRTGLAVPLVVFGVALLTWPRQALRPVPMKQGPCEDG